MKTVLIPIHDGTVTKNLLRTDFFTCLKTAPDTQIVLLLASGDIVAYEAEFAIAGKVIVEQARVYNRADKVELLFSSFFKHSIPTTFMKIRQVDWYWNKGKYGLYFGSSLLRMLGQFRLWQLFLRIVNALEPIDLKVRAVYEKWQPDIVFAPTMVSRVEVALMRLAQKDKKMVIGMAKSFDNLTSKAYLRIHPQYLIVPNQTGVTEATQLYHYPKEQVVVTGIPQYDVYASKDCIEDRESFFAKVTLNPNKKTILYAPAGDWMNDTDHEVLAEILKWTLDERLPNTQVLLRLHPAYESKTEELAGHPNLYVERPGKHFGTLKGYQFDADDVKHLASSLYHADVVINTGSTIMVESCIFDTPVITLGFDGYTTRGYWQSVARYYAREHLVPVINTGGVPIAKSFTDLKTLITTYIANPELHKEERKKAAFAVCGEIDGKAGERAASVVIEAMQRL